MAICFPLSQSTLFSVAISLFVSTVPRFAQTGNWSARSYNLIVILWEPNNIAGNCSPRTFLSSGVPAGSLIRKFCSCAHSTAAAAEWRISPQSAHAANKTATFFTCALQRIIEYYFLYTHRGCFYFGHSVPAHWERGENFRLVKMLFP